MRFFIALVAFTVTVCAFTGLPSNYTTLQKKNACNDYCMGQTESLSTGFKFLVNGWELCSCAPAQATGSWSASTCYAQCYNRCQNTLGYCAWNYATNTDYTGLCCTTSNTNATVQTKCFKTGSGLCYQA
ncbi:unnamed protein product, partial [Mesorhabditis spiculigera]